ncbi:glutathione peroxidase [Filibacter tadaridae]|uniref:Glutathione peroxidase n=1 Tax=Filibacter tadaridae TaxID=2483811 RepID=A0A3P5WU54_9BACL|nr:glutathione peroxidase [Filibacter tadaridae]VDC18749.1 hypothetical protein FILTAD_00129 [Filibacter tadaridae]
MTTVYDFTVEKADGDKYSMDNYRGKPLVIVNTASKCGFTSQFKELQELYDEYKGKGLVILGFPSDNFNNQEFAEMGQTMAFCELNYGVTFPMFSKVNVKGNAIEPLFSYLTSQKKGMITEGIKWNFTKFVIDRDGNIVERFAPQTAPIKMKKVIECIVQ